MIDHGHHSLIIRAVLADCDGEVGGEAAGAAGEGGEVASGNRETWLMVFTVPKSRVSTTGDALMSGEVKPLEE